MKIILDKKVKNKKQYSKQWISRWSAFVMVWLSVFFIADIYFNHCEHLETLCITLVTSIVSTSIGYFCKSYFETKEEKKNEIDIAKLEESYNCGLEDNEEG